MEIKRATAVYSGGGIYLYYAELENGNWIMGSDDGLLIVNTSPIANDETFEQSGYYEWQVEHLVKYIDDSDYQKVLNQVLDVIFKGKTIEEYDNFSLYDLERRYVKLHRNNDCTYLFDTEKRLLYISLSFEDLTDLENCNDYFVVNVDEYETDEETDPIKELIEQVINL